MNKKYDILQDFKGSPDGHTVIQYTKGQTEVELNDALAEVALGEKWAKLSKADDKAAKAKAKAEAEEKEKAERQSAIEKMKTELAQLEADGKAALEADPSGESAKPIEEQWLAKQQELETLLAE